MEHPPHTRPPGRLPGRLPDSPPGSPPGHRQIGVDRVLRLRRRIMARRRPLAAAAAALAVLAVLRAGAEPTTATVPVVIATAQLAGGTRLTPDDVEVRQFRAGDAPLGALSDPAPLLGRVLAGPLGPGEPVTELRVLSAGLLEAYPGLVAVPVRVAETEAARLLRVGDRIDLVASSPEGEADSMLVARSAPVVALPRGESDGAGPLSGAVLVIGVPKEEALVLSGMTVSRIFTLILTS